MTEAGGFVDQTVTGVAEPQPMYKALRESNPVFRSPQAVVLSRLADIEMALKHTELFSSNMDAVDLGNVRPLIPLQIDPPEHAKYRRILDPLFTPREMARREPLVTELVNEMIDRFAARGECDFHAEFAVPLPCTVFLQLLGLPLEDLDRFLLWKDGVIRPAGDSGFDRRHESSAGVAQQIYEYFDKAIDEHIAVPRDDVLSAMIAADVGGQPLSREELLDICFLFLIAGLDTVTDSLDCFFVYLARHPQHRRQLVERPDVLPGAVEELLRWETPVPGVARVATQDVEVGGCPISKGERVSPLLGAANTDPAEFPDPETVDFTRSPNRHRAFGGGPHRCLGSHLARMELRVALREFHRRIPDYEIKPGTQLTYTAALRSVESLPLVFPVR
ncbi:MULTISPECIES: cytochrome P450 [Mycobacterium avium complex (MAC)]|uniref:Cytochrome P450 n=4 Tax=Mycobacterium avium complex (MAC) TaxID=120793 RepID=A0AAW5S5V5_MYCBC|nr:MULTISPECIES: cytochrome P450 [Mycobacterium avium complex (MAC)]ETA97965.1 cytochrome P450 [Mycobacterium avium 10-5581]ETB30291.1 cytochrome P450 [Mycobacterium avium subsp. hominissuis 10-4249]ETB47208.1 cytochrome P450 [Mycobacterium avium 11-0986]EUA37746.1 cytochrome P450 family protein [Mycobacterium avium subsp. avium 2285 (R)]TXA41408.1 cytochrome P450 [Mycobacterium tuberculosis variant bovis]